MIEAKGFCMLLKLSFTMFNILALPYPWAFRLHANVLGLLLGELREAGAQGRQVKSCHLLIKLPEGTLINVKKHQETKGKNSR